MLLNNRRQMVKDATLEDLSSSVCPDCGTPLVARRGDYVAWHWAHKPKATGEIRDCASGGIESEWHIAWKLAFHDIKCWQIEYKINVNGKSYRLDAYNQKRKTAIEFVHSLSDSYLEKHRRLTSAGYKVIWILDGEAFLNNNRRCYFKIPKPTDDHPNEEEYQAHINSQSFIRLLKPKAMDLVYNLRAVEGSAPDCVLVYYLRRFWCVWTKYNKERWYPRISTDDDRIINSFAEKLQYIKSAKTDNH